MECEDVREEKQEAISVVWVTEHGGLGWPDSTSCSEVHAPNNSTSHTKPMKYDFPGKSLMSPSHYKRRSNPRMPWKLIFFNESSWLYLEIKYCLLKIFWPFASVYFTEAVILRWLERLSSIKWNLVFKQFFSYFVHVLFACSAYD